MISSLGTVEISTFSRRCHFKITSNIRIKYAKINQLDRSQFLRKVVHMATNFPDLKVLGKPEIMTNVHTVNSLYCDHPWDYLKVVAIAGWSQ